MKPTDLRLPPDAQAKIQVLELIRQLCRGSLPHATPRQITAYADEIENIDKRLAELRRSEAAKLRDKPEAALAGARE